MPARETSEPSARTAPRHAPELLGEARDLPDLLKIPEVAGALWMRVLLIVGGVLCMGLGVVGWLVPVITGIPFYILGLVLLSMAHPPLGHWVNRKERQLSPRVRLALRPRIRRARKAAQREGKAGTGTGTASDPTTDAQRTDNHRP